MSDHGLDLAVIGNGRTAALLEPTGRLTWWCYPRFDGNPVFSRLLAGDEEKGFTDVVLDDMVSYQSEYLRNTAIVSTVLNDRQGGAVRIVDFAPRFRNYGRMFRPPQLIRIVEPLAGLPRIAIRMRPTHSYGEPIAQRSLGSNHIRYWGGDVVIRLTTDAPLSYIDREAFFVLNRPVGMVLGADEPVPGDLTTLCREFCDRTRDYWMDWVRRLSISYEWQDPIIRAAISLKLSNFEETGGVVAAHPTSIPEAPGSGRTWDYRFCWLRDAYFVVKALNRIGATRTMEDFISFILGIASNHREELRPVYSVVPADPMEETVASQLQGYRGDGPVRVGNAAALQAQNDTYGSIILAAMPMFFDNRLPRPGDAALFQLLETLGEKAAERALQPDSGIWEFRGRRAVHTHSAAMCWAGVNRLGAIANRLNFTDRAEHWNAIADKLQHVLLEQAWNPKLNAFSATLGSDEIDASVLLLPEIGLIEPSDPRFISNTYVTERSATEKRAISAVAGRAVRGIRRPPVRPRRRSPGPRCLSRSIGGAHRSATPSKRPARSGRSLGHTRRVVDPTGTAGRGAGVGARCGGSQRRRARPR